MNTTAKKILKHHGLRNTAFRLRVLDVFIDKKEMALSNPQIEENLSDFDRITLYRTLKSFEQAGIIHQAIDGSNDAKYALCNDNCDVHNHNDDHAHFLCSLCNVTTCIEGILTAPMNMPQSYSVEKIHLAITGVCPDCIDK